MFGPWTMHQFIEIYRTKLPISVCTHGDRELSSPDSFGGGGREVPLAHIISRRRNIITELPELPMMTPSKSKDL